MSNEEKKLLTFPCDYPIKVVGKTGQDFESKALSIIYKHIPEIADGAIQNRLSKDGNYLAITVTFRATSQKQLDELYKELSQEKSIIMTL